MRIANVAGRLHLVSEHGVVDVEESSQGAWSADPQAVFGHWSEFVAWAHAADLTQVKPYIAEELESPVPRPPQIFAIGLNYHDHASEAKLDVSIDPVVFTKFAASVTGPHAVVDLPDGDVDWEVELVAVIGRGGHRIAPEDAWDHIAGLTVGQDLSERRRQFAGSPPQFSLAKSFPGFAPMGPVLVTPDELNDSKDFELGCLLNGEVAQKARTREMIFDAATLVNRLSEVTPLLPGDVIFTGTPSGVGMGRNPQRFLRAGDELVSYVAGIGELRTSFISRAATTVATS